MMSMLHKVRVTGKPESLAELFCTNVEREDHSRSTRQDHLLSLPRIRGTAAGKRQFVHRAAVAYNALPREFVTMSSSLFTSRLRQRLSEVTWLVLWLCFVLLASRSWPFDLLYFYF